jgi:hypothetical protein
VVDTEVPSTQLEAWLNAGKSRVFINRFDGKGGTRQELIAAGRTFHLTPAERRMNQEMAANEKLDLFSNGMLQPVRLGEEAEALAGNPNHLAATDEQGIFRLHWKTFERRITEIDNPTLLERLLELAVDQDATLRQVNLITARLAEVAPPTQEAIRPDPGTGPVPGVPTMRPVTPH